MLLRLTVKTQNRVRGSQSDQCIQCSLYGLFMFFCRYDRGMVNYILHFFPLQCASVKYELVCTVMLIIMISNIYYHNHNPVSLWRHALAPKMLECLTFVLLNPDLPCLCKLCRSRSVGF